jgi:hypothetical protein
MNVRHFILSLIAVPLIMSITFENETCFRIDSAKYTEWFISHKSDFIRTETVGKFTYEIMLVPMEIKLLNYAKSNIQAIKTI